MTDPERPDVDVTVEVNAPEAEKPESPKTVETIEKSKTVESRDEKEPE